MIGLRYVLLLLTTGGAGFLTCVFLPLPNGVMAAVLAMALSGGTVWLSESERRTGKAPSLANARLAGLASGMVAAVLMLGAQFLFPYVEKGGERNFLRPPAIPAWAVITMGIFYGLVLHLAYFQRRGAKHPWRRSLGYACLGAFLLKALVSIPAYMEPDFELKHLPNWVLGMALYSLFGAVPFAFLWTVVTGALDPAWSEERRRECFGRSPDPVQHSTEQADR